MRENLDKFVRLLNEHNVAEISELFDSEISFTDMNGYSTSKKDEVSAGVEYYIKMFPDYKVQVLDIEEMMGSFKVILQTYGTLSDENREQIKQAYGTIPTPEQLHPPQLWKIDFHENKLSIWMMENISESADPKHVALTYIWAINTGIVKNCTSKTSVDLKISHEYENVPIDDTEKFWSDFFDMNPDFTIQPESTHVRGNQVIILGYSNISQLDKDNYKIWEAIIENGMVSQWNIFPYSKTYIDEFELTDYGYKPKV